MYGGFGGKFCDNMWPNWPIGAVELGVLLEPTVGNFPTKKSRKKVSPSSVHNGTNLVGLRVEFLSAKLRINYAESSVVEFAFYRGGHDRKRACTLKYLKNRGDASLVKLNA